MSEPRQYRKDPATGQLVEDALPPADEAELTRLRAEIDADWDDDEPAAVRVAVDDDDASEPDAPTDLESSGLPPVGDPPGGSD